MLKTEEIVGGDGGSGGGGGADGSAAADASATQQKREPQQRSLQDEQQQQPTATALQDLIAGGVAGSASVVVGHPFDTYKVRLQTQTGSSPGGVGRGAASAGQFGGVSSLFRGMTAPLGTAAVINAMIFSAFGESSRYWDEYFERRGRNGEEEGTAQRTDGGESSTQSGSGSLTKSLVCGCFAGAVQCLVICPMEHIKCRLQVQHGIGSADHLYRGPLDAVDKIVESHGLRGLYRGWWSTCLREIPAFGLYFATYDDIKDRINRMFEEEDDGGENGTAYVPHHSHTWAASAVAGGVSGSLTWAVIYPVDVIKSRIQTAPLDCARSEISMWNVGKKIVREYGWRCMFRGLGVTLARAFPVNGIIFPVYEFTLMRLTGAGIGGGS